MRGPGARLPAPRLGARRAGDAQPACPTTAAGWTSRTAATTSAAPPGPSARCSRAEQPLRGCTSPPGCCWASCCRRWPRSSTRARRPTPSSASRAPRRPAIGERGDEVLRDLAARLLSALPRHPQRRLALVPGHAGLRRRPAAPGADRGRRTGRRRRSCSRSASRRWPGSATAAASTTTTLVLVGRRVARHAPTRRCRRSRDEQPLDAAALVEAEVEAFAITGSARARATRHPRLRVVPRRATGSASRSTTSPPAAATTGWARRR